MMRELGAKLVAPAPPDMRPFENLLREISQKLDRGAAAAPAGELTAMIRELGQRIDQRVGQPLDVRPLEEALRALHDRLEVAAPARLDMKFVEQAADLLAERLERRSGGRVDADCWRPRSPTSTIVSTRCNRAAPTCRAGAARRRSGRRARRDASHAAGLAGPGDGPSRRRARRAARRSGAGGPTHPEPARQCAGHSRAASRPARPAGGRDLPRRRRARRPARRRRGRRAYAASASASAGPFRAASSAPLAAPRCATVPERDPPPPLRAIDGADFLLEPGAKLTPGARAETGDSARPRARSTPISPPRVAPPRRRRPRAAPPHRRAAGAPRREPPRALVARAGRRRFSPPGVAGRADRAALIAALATFAVIELRGGRLPLLQSRSLGRRRPMAPRDHCDTARRRPNSAAPISIPADRLDRDPGRRRPRRRPATVASISAAAASLRDSAAAGDAGAEFEFALRLSKAGMARDPHAAAQWFEQAANRGLPIAEYRLATLYEKGVGVTRDLPAAMSWYAKAATAGQRAGDAQSRRHARRGVDRRQAGLRHGGGMVPQGRPVRAFATASSTSASSTRAVSARRRISARRGCGSRSRRSRAISTPAHKRDDVAAKMDPAAVNAAAAALGAFKLTTPAARRQRRARAARRLARQPTPQANATPAKPATAL